MPKAKEPAEPIKPTEYTPELGERLCERMLQPNGDKSVTSLRAACLQADLPDVDRVMRWLAKGRAEEAGEFADFVKLYDEAKRLQAEIGAAEVVEISDDVAAARRRFSGPSSACRRASGTPKSCSRRCTATDRRSRLR
jgi:hypothetical protein